MAGKSARDEGARHTKQVMAEVTRLRLTKAPKWSAERLAEEMTKAGVPWNTDVVVNLEHGRRKSLRVHELLALAWVLDASPADLLAPSAERYTWVLPGQSYYTVTVRSWLDGETGPLRTRKPWGAGEVKAAAEEMAEEFAVPGLTAGALEEMVRKAVERNAAVAGQDEAGDHGQG